MATGTRVVAQTSTRLHTFDAGTGEAEWEHPTEPAVRDGVAYTGVELGPRNGELLVFADCGVPDCPPAWVGGEGAVSSSGGAADPAVAGDLVYHAFSDFDEEAETATSRLEVYDADGCGAARCSPLAAVASDAAPTEVLVSHGRVIVVTIAGLRVFGLP